ncbi:MAG TPA: alpha/beta family hydrolase [Candidatus Limnocylindrales bacterium]|nr:alpha/beta family hydrolase [Candidatus Limnocylindrales bacterium]
MPSRILLAPGASGSIEQLRDHERGLTARGFDVSLVELPRGRAERAVPVYEAAIADAGDPPPIIGGQSFGGRVASLVAAELPPAGMVLLCYPLHAPGRQPSWDERTAHWPRIACPVLLLSGESDPFAEIGLLRQAATRLPDATLVTYPGVGHGLGPVLDDALDRITAFASERT